LKRLPSLRLRLLLGGAAWIAVALVTSWAFIFASFSSLIDTDRRADLEASLNRLVAEIDPDATVPLPEGPLSDPRYDTPLGGVYWQVKVLDSGDVIRSRSLWDIELPAQAPADGRADFRQFAVPDGPLLVALTRTIRINRSDGTERRFLVTVGEERNTESDPIGRFGTTLALFLAILALMLIVAAAVQVHFGLEPLRTLKRNIAGIRAGKAERLAADVSDELRPVVEEINELLDAHDATNGFARERAADLAHGLKTPLAILGATADRLRTQGDVVNADALRLLTEQMNERVDYQLRLAQLRFRTRALGVSSSVNEAVLRSVAVLRKNSDGERLNWLIDIEDQLEVDMDRHDLMELVGILLENAQQWARQRISIRGARHGDLVDLVIEDDGVGLSDEQIEKLGQRGVRLDERSHGHGLGLAIAFEIMRLNRGSLQLGRSGMGGLIVGVQFTAGNARVSGRRSASAVNDQHDLERVGRDDDDPAVRKDEEQVAAQPRNERGDLDG
jgi:signal transduction histidine kinase